MNEVSVYSSQFEDLVQGNKIVTEQLTSLEKVIELIVKDSRVDTELVGIFEQLAEYLTDNPDREIIGLEEKLERGNRPDLKRKAVRLKNTFARKITKKQLSPVFQKVHLQVLSSIITAFEAHVRPLISSEASQSDIDKAIYEYVILPAHKGMVRFDDLTTTEDVCGMLYFLTGLCHLVWSREC